MQGRRDGERGSREPAEAGGPISKSSERQSTSEASACFCLDAESCYLHGFSDRKLCFKVLGGQISSQLVSVASCRITQADPEEETIASAVISCESIFSFFFRAADGVVRRALKRRRGKRSRAAGFLTGDHARSSSSNNHSRHLISRLREISPCRKVPKRVPTRLRRCSSNSSNGPITGGFP